LPPAFAGPNFSATVSQAAREATAITLSIAYKMYYRSGLVNNVDELMQGATG